MASVRARALVSSLDRDAPKLHLLWAPRCVRMQEQDAPEQISMPRARPALT